jgi:hypothetical protein
MLLCRLVLRLEVGSQVRTVVKVGVVLVVCQQFLVLLQLSCGGLVGALQFF